jgi:hypothetical protein
VLAKGNANDLVCASLIARRSIRRASEPRRACRRGSDAFYTRRWPTPDETTGAVVLAHDDEGVVMQPAGRRGRRHRGRRGRVDDIRWWRTRRRWRGRWARVRHTASMSGCSRSIATSARQPPPTARSVMTFPGHAPPGPRDRSSAADRPQSRPVTRRVWVSTSSTRKHDPVPSADKRQARMDSHASPRPRADPPLRLMLHCACRVSEALRVWRRQAPRKIGGRFSEKALRPSR